MNLSFFNNNCLLLASPLHIKPLSLACGVSSLLLIAPPVLAQMVVPDGGTATSVSLGTSGQITVGLAPANAASISHNTYTSFSVPNSGVSLDNSIVSAGTIVNEVTSTNLTTIEGALTVIGTQADVIIANPNGITVNGGRFQNTRNVALTTGIIGSDTSGRVTSSVNSGAIIIGAGGLSGTMEELALISKSLKVNGAVSYDTPDAKSHVNIITGESTVNFDPARGGGGILPWGLISNSGTGTSNAVIVDITDQGSLSSGRISVTVTDAGAGVRFAGDQMASAGGFRLTSSGKLELLSGKIEAKGSVNISVASTELVSSASKRAEISSEESGVVIRAKAGDINLGQASVSGRTNASDNFASSGGVTLIATGDIRANRTDDRKALLSSSESNVVVLASGAASFDGLDVATAEDFRISANGAINLADAVGIIGADFRLFSNENLNFDASVFTAQSDIRLDGGSLRFGSEDIAQVRTELKAVNGGFVIKSTSGNILNFGSLLQGKNATAGDVESLGGLSIYAAGLFQNKSLSVDRLAVAFGQEDNLFVEAGGDVLNQTGRLFSNKGITIVSEGDILNETNFTVEAAPFEVVHIKGGRFAGSLFLKRKRSTQISADFGEQSIAGEQSFILGVGDVSLTANNIRNIGAEINGAALNIDAVDSFTNEVRQTGKLSFSQTCKLFCKTSGSSTLRSMGGTVNASDELAISAGAKVTNLAGRFSGVNGVTITSPLIKFTPSFTATLVERPTGISGFFRGERAFLSTSSTYGSLSSINGTITIDGDVSLGGTTGFSEDNITITGTRIETEILDTPQPIGRQPIGFFWNIF